MKRFAIGVSVLLFIFGLSGVAYAQLVTVAATPISITVDQNSYQLISEKPEASGPTIPDGTGLMWEWNSDKNVWKTCLCRMVAFRALQALEDYLGLEGINSNQVNIVTGWNTHGPEELYVDLMPWVEDVNFNYVDNITPGADLTLNDAWFIFTVEGYGSYKVSSSASNYEYQDDVNVAGYTEGWDFFDYRSYVKNGGTEDAATYFANVIRSQVAENFKGATCFEVKAVPVPGSALLMIFGLLGICGVSRQKG